MENNLFLFPTRIRLVLSIYVHKCNISFFHSRVHVLEYVGRSSCGSSFLFYTQTLRVVVPIISDARHLMHTKETYS